MERAFAGIGLFTDADGNITEQRITPWVLFKENVFVTADIWLNNPKVQATLAAHKLRHLRTRLVTKVVAAEMIGQ